MANISDLNFDASQVEPNQGFDPPVPTGDYPAVIVDSKFKPTSANDGSEFLELTNEIIDGPYRGRRVIDRLNLKNKNETAVKIARGTLSAICHAVNVMRPRDTAELHNKPFLMSVDIEERDGKDKQGNPKTFHNNRVKKYAPAAGGAVAGAPASGGATADKPWLRKAAG